MYCKRTGHQMFHIEIVQEGDTAALLNRTDRGDLVALEFRLADHVARAVLKQDAHAMMHVLGLEQRRGDITDQAVRAAHAIVQRPPDKALADRTGDRKEHTSALQSLMRSSYAVFCLKTTPSQQHNPEQRM